MSLPASPTRVLTGALTAVVATTALLVPAATAGSVAETRPGAAATSSGAASSGAAPSADVVLARRVPQAVARYERKALKTTNRQRAEQRLRALRKKRCLLRAARRQARAMADSQSIFHQQLGPVMRRCGLSMAGENVAMGYPNGRAVVRAWMDSPGHRENILRREYRLVGIGAAKGADGRWYSAQVFGRG